MSEEEIKERLNYFKTISILYGNTIAMSIEVLKQLQKDIETVLQLLEQKDNKIKQLNKGINTLMTKRKKWKNRYYKINADLYSANKIIDDYIEERNRLKNKMIGDKMEQFDDYVIYLIESYLEILEE